MSSLEIGQVTLMHSDGFLELLDILCTPFTESSLRLAISLLPLLRGGIYLTTKGLMRCDFRAANFSTETVRHAWELLRLLAWGAQLTGLRPPFRLAGWFSEGMEGPASLSGVETGDSSSEFSLEGSFLSMDILSDMSISDFRRRLPVQSASASHKRGENVTMI